MFVENHLLMLKCLLVVSHKNTTLGRIVHRCAARWKSSHVMLSPNQEVDVVG